MADVQPSARTEVLTFDNNALLAALFGSGNAHLERVEKALNIACHSRGNTVTLEGPDDAVDAGGRALNALYRRLLNGEPVEAGDVDGALRMAVAADPVDYQSLTIRTKKRHVAPRSPGQAAYVEALRGHSLVVALGPAGTGKTYMAVAQAVAMMLDGSVDRIILSRPAVEAGERLGFLPGDMREKVDPYLRPLYDALFDMLPGDRVMALLDAGQIEVAPLAFMRGRTLSNAFVILDEAQNTTPTQMKMLLTRLGENARMVVTGDMSQVDLPLGAKSGLADALEILPGLTDVAITRFTSKDVVRHPLVTRIVNAYEARDSKDALPQGQKDP